MADEELAAKLSALALQGSDEAHHRKMWAVAELLAAAELLVISMHDEAIQERELATTMIEEEAAGREARTLSIYRVELAAMRRRIPLGVK